MKISSFDQSGKVAGSVDIDVDKIKVTNSLLHQAVLRTLSNARPNLAKTKDRSERRGGGRKPWRQKGTGNARQGSIRSPQWRKGGVTHGPTGNENYTLNMPKSARKAAVRMAIKVALQDEKVHHITELKLSELKTKELLKALNALPAKDKRRILIVTKEDNQDLSRCAGNLQNVKLIRTDQLNVPDLIRTDCALVIGEAVEDIKKVLA